MRTRVDFEIKAEFMTEGGEWLFWAHQSFLAFSHDPNYMSESSQESLLSILRYTPVMR